MMAPRIRKETFGTITYNPQDDRFTLASNFPLEELLPQKLSAPVTLHWITTMKCNSRCPYCYELPWLLKVSETENILSETQAKSLIEQCSFAGVLRLYLTGGEPTLHPFLDKMIRYSYENNIKCVVNTNGIKMPDQVYNALVECKSRLSISLDSYKKEEHDAIRKQNSFDSIMQLLERAALDCLDTRLISVMQRPDEHYWLTFGKFLTEHGVKNWFIQPEAKKGAEAQLLEVKLRETFPEIRIRILQAIYNSFLYILPDGTVASELWTPQKKVYGILPKEDILAIWDKNEKNKVADHQSILHIETRGRIK